jgi:hypothetical protein
MARLGVPSQAADKALNHHFWVTAVYQRHEFPAERNVALHRWGAHSPHIVEAFKAKAA